MKQRITFHEFGEIPGRIFWVRTGGVNLGVIERSTIDGKWRLINDYVLEVAESLTAIKAATRKRLGGEK